MCSTIQVIKCEQSKIKLSCYFWQHFILKWKCWDRQVLVYVPLDDALPVSGGGTQWLTLTNRMWQHDGTLLPKWGHEKPEASSWALSLSLTCSEGVSCCVVSCPVDWATWQGMNVSGQQPGSELGGGPSSCWASVRQLWPTAELQSPESLWARDTSPASCPTETLT